MPRPAYLTDEWLREHGVRDIDELLGALRPETVVMRPESLRAIKATRLSFARNLISRMARERWRIELRHMEMDRNGVGRFIYGIEANGHQLHFGMLAFAPQEVEWPGRIADAGFDFLGAVLDGPVDAPRMWRELDELNGKMWSGRTDNQCYGWTAINRSNRFFDHTVERLAEGKQPDLDFLATGGGYIVRNAGWHGNGRFGTRSWLSFPPDHPFSYPYHMDLFALYIERVAGFDVAEAIARARNLSSAATLSPELKRVLGIGNSSGVGMVAALVRWPTWMSAYHYPRELALAYAKTRTGDVQPRARRLHALLERAAAYYDEQPSCPVPEIGDPRRMTVELRSLARVADELASRGTIETVRPTHPWAAMAAAAARSGNREIEEQMNALLVELFPEFGDAVSELFPVGMKQQRRLEPEMTLARLRSLIERRYDWALEIDRSSPEARAYFWYRSEVHGENRRGERAIDAGSEKETFVDVTGAVQALYADLTMRPPEMTAARFLLEFPQHAHAASRVQTAARLPYSEIRGNIVDCNFLPMDGIRFLLSMMGLECSHPNNTRWVRGVFLQGAPTPGDILRGAGDDWIFPTLRSAAVA